jgi:hypothetical protein
MIEFVDYKAEHAVEIMPYIRPLEQTEETRESAAMWAVLREENQRSGNKAWTMLKDGIPLCCGGFMMYWQGVAEAWFMLSQKGMPHAKTILRESRKFMEGYIKQFNIHRMQAFINAQDETACRWAERYGLIRGQIIEQFGPHKEDFIIFGKVI